MGLDTLSWSLSWKMSFPNNDDGDSSDRCAVHHPGSGCGRGEPCTSSSWLVMAGVGSSLIRHLCYWLWVSCKSAPRDFMLQGPGCRSSPVRTCHCHGRESRGAAGNNGCCLCEPLCALSAGHPGQGRSHSHLRSMVRKVHPPRESLPVT